MKWSLLVLFLLAVSGEAGEPFPKNVARAHLGARWIAGDGPPLHDDVSATIAIPRGNQTYLLDLGAQYYLSRLTFGAHGLSGMVAIETSVSQHFPKWHAVGEISIDSGAQALALRSSQARFVRFHVKATRAGELYGLGLFGVLWNDELQPMDAAALRKRGPVLSHEFSLTNGLAGHRVVETSSGEGRLTWLADEDVATRYAFDRDDARPRFVIDLAATADVGRIAILHSKVSGTWAMKATGAEAKADRSTGLTVFDDWTGSLQRLVFEWEGETPMIIDDVVVLASHSLPRHAIARVGYGKNSGYGKNAKNPSPSADPKVSEPRSFVPYYGPRAAGPIGDEGPRQPGTLEGPDELDGPVITPASR